MLEVDITLRRKSFSLRINESFASGITGVYGRNGSGKTSMLLTIAGLEKTSQGRLVLNGRELLNSAKRIDMAVEKRRIGYVFQEGRLFPHMKIEKNLRYGFRKNHEAWVTFNEVVELLELQGLLKQSPAQISGGEKQRVALGRAMLSSPEIILLDEPFSAVDITLRRQIIPFIIRIQKRLQVPVLVVSHDLPDLLKLTNRLMIIQNGECLGHGVYHDLLLKSETSEILSAQSLLNVIDVEIVENKSSSMTAKVHQSQEIFIKCKKSQLHREGQALKVIIQADDISLAKRKVVDISVQNQLPGKITAILQRDSRLFCVVEVGFKLLVEITKDSLKQLDLAEGSQVWCLFKSAATDVVG